MGKFFIFIISSMLMTNIATGQNCYVAPVHGPQRPYIKPDDSTVEGSVLKGSRYFVVKMEQKRLYGSRKEHSVYQCGIISNNLDTITLSTYHPVDHIRIIKLRDGNKIYYYEMNNGLKLIREENL